MAVGERQDVADETLRGVVAHRSRAGATAVATQVGRDGAVSGAAERHQLVAPGPRRLGEAVQEQDPTPSRWTAGPPGEGQSAGLDLEPVDCPRCFHDSGARQDDAAAAPSATVAGFLRAQPEDLLGNGVDELALCDVVVGDGGEHRTA